MEYRYKLLNYKIIVIYKKFFKQSIQNDHS